MTRKNNRKNREYDKKSSQQGASSMENSLQQIELRAALVVK
ncbi:hypothetical protein A3Q56_02050 [Intoshia linei]|uniref:Uncharacterized protein n=1 Tax=Intoshia linei TaxID=1819745 RepID=A0A177B7B2_9BILA|nr:hypothetical protein A3Q56_02050 [Intoshia linei]